MVSRQMPKIESSRQGSRFTKALLMFCYVAPSCAWGARTLVGVACVLFVATHMLPLLLRYVLPHGRCRGLPAVHNVCCTLLVRVRPPVLLIALNQVNINTFCPDCIKSLTMLCVRGASSACARTSICLAVLACVICNTPSSGILNQQCSAFGVYGGYYHPCEFSLRR